MMLQMPLVQEGDTMANRRRFISSLFGTNWRNEGIGPNNSTSFENNLEGGPF
jgi:hypothetical protein